jgi:iron complex transport system ATP-binding protein
MIDDYGYQRTTLNGQDVVWFQSVSIWTPEGKTIVRDLNWRVRSGERWALIGPNGSGKTTMLSLAGAWRYPSRGKVSVLGKTLGQVDMPALRRSIGFVDSSGSPLDWMTGEEVVLTGKGATVRPIWWEYTEADKVHARKLLSVLGCSDLADREISTCSQGEKGRLRIARALMAQPRLLLLDEPAVGLDFAAREALIAALDRLHEKDSALASILVTHHLEEIPPTTTHALLLREGRCVANGPIERVLTSEYLSLCFGLPVDCHRNGSRWSATAPAVWKRASS